MLILSLSFVGVLMWVFALWTFEAHVRWDALMLSRKAMLPPKEEMKRVVTTALERSSTLYGPVSV